MVVIAGPAGAIVNACDNSMNPANSGNSSGLIIACTFADAAAAGTSLTIDDYKDAVWHAGSTRNVTVTVSRGNGSEAGHYVLKWTGTNLIGQLGPQASDVNHSIENNQSKAYFVNGDNNAGVDHTPLAAFIDAGTTIRSVVTGVGGYWVLSKPTVTGRPPSPNWSVSSTGVPSPPETVPSPRCANGSSTTTCATSQPITLAISNNVGREGNNGSTSAGSNTVTSAFTAQTGCTATDCTGAGTGNTAAAQGMNFTSADLGNFLSGGDLPDGAQISVINSATSVDLGCQSSPGVGGAPAWNWGATAGLCLSVPAGGFGSVTAASGLILTITPYPIPTSTRFMSGIKIAGGVGTHTLSSSTGTIPLFSKFDVGLQVRGCSTPANPPNGSICNPATTAPTNARITAVTAGGSTADVTDGCSSAACTAVGTWTNNALATAHIVVGFASKTAPATGGVVGFLAIGLEVDPGISPTAPPCAAHKVSGFQLPVKWRNPGGAPTTIPDANGGYDFGNVGLPVNQYSGFSHTGVSIAQLAITTSVTTFAGFVRQNLSVAATVPTTTRWQINFEFLPVGIGLCTSDGPTGIAETLNIMGLESKHALNPSGTGGGFGATRALLPELQNRLTTYTGDNPLNQANPNKYGAHVTAGGAQTETNTCKISSPNIIGIGCQP